MPDATDSRAPVPVLLMVRELGWGGTERQLTELAKALDRSRFAPHIAAFRASGPRASELRECGLPVVEFPVTSFLKPKAVEEARQLRAYVRHAGIRVVHAFDYPVNIWAVPAAKMAGTRVVLASQRGHRYNYLPKYRALLRLSDVFADGIVVNCEAIRSHLKEHYSVPERKIRLCHNGVDMRVFRPGPREAAPGLESATDVIGTVAVLRPEKGVAVLLESFRLVAAQRPGARLVIVGSGPVEAELRERAEALGIGMRCVFRPATSDVARWLRAFDIFVLPSLNEALSNSLMEAMACGCAVVASDVGGNPELVADGETGLLFECGNARQLADKLVALMNGPDLRARLGECASRRIAAEFTIDKSARRMEAIYTEFLNRH